MFGPLFGGAGAGEESSHLCSPFSSCVQNPLCAAFGGGGGDDCGGKVQLHLCFVLPSCAQISLTMLIHQPKESQRRRNATSTPAFWTSSTRVPPLWTLISKNKAIKKIPIEYKNGLFRINADISMLNQELINKTHNMIYFTLLLSLCSLM